MTYLLDIYAAVASLPDRVWLALAFSVLLASAITLAFRSFGDL